MQLSSESSHPFLSYSRYLKKKYGAPAYRIAVDGGFSCPNRSGDRYRGGCSFCDPLGSRAFYTRNEDEEKERGLGGLPLDGSESRREFPLFPTDNLQNIRQQVDKGREFLLSRYGAEILILYFQAFSGTWAPPEKLKEIYDYALGLADFKELIISTRPDCIDGAVADLLEGYIRRDIEVWIELGLQSANDISLNRINRGHLSGEFEQAFTLLRSRGIKLSVHLIFGLPGENWNDIEKSIRLVAKLKPEAVKIHNLHIPGGTPLCHEYMTGELTVPAWQRHREYIIKALEQLPPDTIIQRLTTDTPDYNLAAPRCFLEKNRFINALRDEMIRQKTWQGRLYNLP